MSADSPRWLLPDLLEASNNPEAAPSWRLPGRRPERGSPAEPSPDAQCLRWAALGERARERWEGSNKRAPAALAWAWSELDERERALAKALPPKTLAHWLGGSFDHPRAGFTAGPLGPDTMAMAVASSFGPGGAALRRALRAKTLAALAARPGAWGAALRSARSRKDAAGWSDFPELERAAGRSAWRAGEIQRGAGLFIAGMSAFGLLPLGPLAGLGAPAEILPLIAGHGAALGAAAYGLFGMARPRNHPDPCHGPRFQDVWGASGRGVLAAIYPDFERAGVFEAWSGAGSFEASLDAGFVYQGLAKAGFDAQELMRRPPFSLQWSEFGLGEPALADAVEALLQAQALALCAQAPAKASPARAPRL